MLKELEFTEEEKTIHVGLAMRFAVVRDGEHPSHQRRGVRLVEVCRPVIRPIQGGRSRGVGPFCVTYVFGGEPIVLAGEAVNS